jgi:hypothetical protein
MFAHVSTKYIRVKTTFMCVLSSLPGNIRVNALLKLWAYIYIYIHEYIYIYTHTQTLACHMHKHTRKPKTLCHIFSIRVVLISTTLHLIITYTRCFYI